MDDRGVRMALSRPPQRIVSVFPALTEAVCALGACERLVGVDRYSNFPPQVRALPQVGGGLDPNLEAIVALRPDLVLMATSTRGAPRLETLGLAVAAMQPARHAEVRQMLQRVAALLGLPPQQAEAAWARIQFGLAQARQDLPVGWQRARVYLEVSAGPYAAGEASFIGETLAQLGLRNIVPAALGPFPRLNPEFAVAADPDLLIVPHEVVATLAQRPGWAQLRAVRARQICALEPAELDALVRAGPRLAEGAQRIVACVRGLGRAPLAGGSP